jgi:protein SCO1/2
MTTLKAIALLPFALLPQAAWAQRADEKPDKLNGVDIVQRLHQQVPRDIELRDEAGYPVAIGTYFTDRPVILALVYYECPMLCTLVLNGLLRSLRVLDFDLGDEFDVITVSFDPRDTSEIASAKRLKYLREYGREVTDGWRFLTGDEPQIRRLADAVGFKYTFDPETGQFAHATAIMILTPEGRVSRYFMGVEYAPRDLKLALMDAAKGAIGSPADKILHYCFAYDPTTGKYGLAIVNILRAGGVATLIALGSFIALMLRRDRHARADATSTGNFVR